ncbi:MAG: hypothetical protein IJ379_12820 [Lachnospiraceae bacterium]|nr:hypothetical protein [Lachnospiraceae bacterium]
MDYRFDRMNNFRRGRYMGVKGRIVSIEPTRFSNRGAEDCMMFVGVETDDGSMVNFIVSPATFVVDYITLREGMTATFFHRTDVPVPLIYPPQYNAVVVAPEQQGSFVFVGRFNNSLVSDDQSLQLNMNNEVPVVTTMNQTFMGNIANHDLVVIYSNTTRSIPAQTTPSKVVVLCQQDRM